MVIIFAGQFRMMKQIGLFCFSFTVELFFFFFAFIFFLKGSVMLQIECKMNIVVQGVFFMFFFLYPSLFIFDTDGHKHGRGWVGIAWMWSVNARACVTLFFFVLFF